MDGQYHSVEFHPSSTSREVMEIIRSKIGLHDNAQGYAVYEVLGASERSLMPDEKIADVMSKWEKYRNAAAQAVQQNQTNSNVNSVCRRQHHLFLFKKHLFHDRYMNLDDPVEKELLYHQVLHSLRTDRFPITEMEAVMSLNFLFWRMEFQVFYCFVVQVMLTALQGQLELGDCTEVLQDYRAIANHCLPPRYVPNIPHGAVAMHHQSLRGMTAAEAKKSFLNLIQSWPLHKATIFDVMQSFTSNWPRVLWLAVDQKGVHLLEHRSRNALCTYDYPSILSYSPNMNCLMIITGTDKKQSKVIITTAQVCSLYSCRMTTSSLIIISFVPEINGFVIVLFFVTQAFQIANLIREYTEVANLVAAENLAAETLANGNVGTLPLPPMIPPSQQQNPQAAALQLQQQQQQQQAASHKHLMTAKGNRPASMQFRSSTALVAPQPS